MSEISVNSILDASGGATTTINGFTPTVSNMAGRNRIINGDMRIDQRNAGAAVSTPPNYVLDRWKIRYNSNGGTAGTCTVQRSATSPSNFTNSQLLTVGTARTVVSGDRFGIEQPIEGFNMSDLGWGTASAQSVTVSFWVRSSVTGNFGLCLSNFSRAISALYTVNAANTWEYKTVTFVGDTSGTWDTTNGTGVLAVFDLGMGSDVRLAPGAWTAGTYLGATGGTNFVSTAGATFYITGVQLEAGSVATPFEHRMYGQELQLAQRYFQAIGGDSAYERFADGVVRSSTVAGACVWLKQEMRAIPTTTFSSASNFQTWNGSSTQAVTGISADQSSRNVANLDFTVASGLTSAAAIQIIANSTTSAKLFFSSEL